MTGRSLLHNSWGQSCLGCLISELSCRSRIAALSDKVSLLERKVEFLEARRQLREDWNNREYAQVVSDNIRHIADFLCNFELSCRSRIAALSDKVSLLERKVEFLEAR
ncbi:hypothetical protein WUBG_15600, partial [Wuchereria bancrofti]